MKNLGANEALVGKTYGVGLDVDQVFTTNLQLSYNLPHWKLGVEYSPSIAWYGNVDLQDGGRIHDTHSITNHRVLGVLIYTFLRRHGGITLSIKKRDKSILLIPLPRI